MSSAKLNTWAKSREYDVSYNGCRIGYESSEMQNTGDCLIAMKNGLDQAEANGEHYSATLSFSWGGKKNHESNKSETITDDFMALFPKYVRLSKYEWSANEYTRNPQGGHSVRFGVSYDSDRDGKKNETGRKRFDKFCSVLRHWNMI